MPHIGGDLTTPSSSSTSCSIRLKSIDKLRFTRLRIGERAFGEGNGERGSKETIVSRPEDGRGTQLCTKCGGIISPSVRMSFAMRFLRSSTGDGNTGVDGVGINDELVGVGDSRTKLLLADNGVVGEDVISMSVRAG